MAYLSVHPEIQDALYREVQEVAHGEYPTYKDMNKLPLCLAACYEALRLRDMSIFIPKEASEDTVIAYNRWDEQGRVTKHRHAIKKGSRIIIDTPAIQRNPFHWPDPMKYDPTRHLGDHGKIFSGFSLGQRHCIGKRYAEVELVAFISRLIKAFKVHPVPLTPGESKESMLARMVRLAPLLPFFAHAGFSALRRAA
jgi:cytochrome P450